MKKELDNGLTLRSLSEGIQSDYDNLPQFYVDVFAGEGEDDAETIGPWTEDLISGNHPTMSLDDVWVIVDSVKDEQIVSALLLIPQVWRYDAIEFPVGRVEIVATHKDYRRRGLIRQLMAVAHERSASLGHMVQGITGIQHYYRQFGYGMAINLGIDSQIPITSIPKLKPDQTVKYTLRPATTDDIPQIIAWEAYDRQDGGLSLKREADIWEFDLTLRQPGTFLSQAVYIIVDTEGRDVGYVSFVMDKYFPTINVWQFIVSDQSSYFETYDDVLRGIKTIADEYYAELPGDKYPTKLRFDSGVSPAIKSLVRRTDSGVIYDRPYAWYIRIADLPAFIKHIAPVLEKRIFGSGVNRFTGELKISFYQTKGLNITFEDGKITDSTRVDVQQYGNDAAMPYHTFFNILFGHRTWRELAYILPDASANRKADMLFTAMFPKMRTQLIDGVG